jgi:hypothetical protein
MNGLARHIEALLVQRAAAILLAATSKSPTKAATTEVWEADLVRLPLINFAFFVQHCTDLSNLSVGNQVEGFEDVSLVPCGFRDRM